MLDDEVSMTWVDVCTTVETDGGGAGIGVIESTKVVVGGMTAGDAITVVVVVVGDGGGSGKEL